MDLDRVPTARGLIILSTPLPCRYCHLPSYLAEADDNKMLHPLHPCCQFWIGQEGRATCVACANFNSRRSGGRTRAQAPPGSTSASMPRPRPNSAQRRKDFDEDTALLLVLRRLREDGGWVSTAQLMPLVSGRIDLLDQLHLAGIEQRGTNYRIKK